MERAEHPHCSGTCHWRERLELLKPANSGHPSVCIQGQVKTDCRHTAFRSACSRPVTQGCWLLVGNAATILTTEPPAPGHDRSVDLGRAMTALDPGPDLGSRSRR